MAKKDIQVFSMSFLDLLSGALAAVIILFIIVPKMDRETQEAAEAIDNLDVNIENIDSIVQSLEGMVEQEVLDEINRELEEMRENLEAAQQQIEDLQEQVEQLEEQVEQLEEQVEEMQQQIEDLQEYKEWMENCGFTPEDGCPVEPPKTTFMAISTAWQEPSADIDMWIVSPSGKTFSYTNVRFPSQPGLLSRDSQEGPGIELFEILNPPAGTYGIYLNLYSGGGASPDLRIFYPKGTKEYTGININSPYDGDDVSNMRLVTKVTITSSGDYEFSN